MADVASLAVGLHLNAASFKAQLFESLGNSERRFATFNSKARTDAKKTTDAYSGLSREIAKASGLIAGLTGAGLSFGSIINTTRKYEQSLSDLSAITGATGRQLNELNKAAQDMGRSTGYSASEAVEALKLMASAKPELMETADGLATVTKSALVLAQSSGVALPEATKALALSLNQFSASAKEADRFINVLAAGAAAGNSEVQDTAAAIKNSGVAAAQAKIPFEQLNAAIQVLAEREVKGGEAGTALRNVILRLEKATDGNLKPSVVGLEKALENLSKKNLSTTQAIKLFGLENYNAAAILVSQREKLNSLTQALTGTQSAHEQAAVRVNNLNGDLQALAGSFEGMAIKIGQSSSGPLRGAIKGTSDAVNYLAENFDTVSKVALYTLIPVLANKLTAGLQQNITAWVNSEMAARKAAVQQAATAKAALEGAQAIKAQTIAHNQWMAAQSAINRQNGLVVNYQADYVKNARVIREATIAETAAKRQLTAANAQLAVSARAASAAGGLMRGALGLVGGPMGIAVMAAAGIATFAANAFAAKSPTEDLSERVRQLTADMKTLQLTELDKTLGEVDKQLENVAGRWKSLEVAKKTGGDVPTYATDKLTAEQAELNKSREALVKRREEIEKQASIKPEQISYGSSFSGSGGAGKHSGQVNQFNTFRQEIEQANASSLARIDLQEQQAKQKMLDSAKKSSASLAEVEALSVQISQKYTRERQALAEQFSPGKALIRKTQETNDTLKELYARELLNAQEYNRAKQALYVDSTRERLRAEAENAVNPMDRLRADVDPTAQIQNEYTQKLALLDAYQQEEVLRAEGHAQRIAEIEERYGQLRVQAESDRTQKLQQTSAQAAQTMFTVTSQFASLTSDLIQNSGHENTTAMKVLLAVQKALAIPSIMVQTQMAAAAARAHGALLGGLISGETAADFVQAQGMLSIGIVASQALTGMAHSGIDDVPKEGTWLLDKGERVVDRRTNEDLKTYLKSQNQTQQRGAGGTTQINIEVPVSIAGPENSGGSDSSISPETAKLLSQFVTGKIREALVEQSRDGGLLSRR
ncbi:phage tail tape measure protein [Leminorella grimontii]|uniref:phage tail tape measure protein n=1 Tax=Leminorella grimontii TaxID=82981 RepID=UPI00321F7CDC